MNPLPIDFKVTQELVDGSSQELLLELQRSGVPQEELREIEMERVGGDCPWCKKPWVKKHASGDVHAIENGKPVLKVGFFGAFDYWAPTCYCYAKWARENKRNEDSRSYLDTALLAARMPKTEWEVSWDNWDYSVSEMNNTAMKAVYEWSTTGAWRNGQGIVLCGGVGTGKTRCALTAAKTILEAEPGIRVRFLPMADLLGAVIRDQTDRGFIESLLCNQVVIVDDMDKVPADKDWARSQVFNFYDACLRDGIPLIGTTNLSGPDEMAQVFDYAVVSRIIGKCKFVRFSMDTKDDYRIIRRRYENKA